MRKSWFLTGIPLAVLAVIASLVLGYFTLRVASAAAAAQAPAQPQQYPLMDKIADKIIQKYQTSSCEQLAQEKAQQQGQPKSPEQQRAIGILRNDPQMRQAFINKVAAPIANKLFDCGMIP